MNHQKLLGFLSLMLLIEGSFAATTEAGPLLDWLRGRNRNQQPEQVAYMPATGCETCTMTCQRQVVNYMPQTEYRTNWVQVPVTSYRPVTSSDPLSGCTVTCMRPCTTYRWQAQRVPFTTYRPVVSNVTVQRPVTSMMPAASGCSTCGVPSAAPTMQSGGVLTPGGSYLSNPTPITPYPGTTYPNGTSPTGSGGTLSPSPIPANNPPSLDPNALPNTMQRIVIPPRTDSSILTIPQPPATSQSTIQPPPGVNAPIYQAPATNSSTNSSTPSQGIQPINDPNPNLRIQPPTNTAPKLLSPHDQTAQAPIRQSWDYTPVRLAVYQESSAPVVSTVHRVEPSPQPAPATHGWRSLNQNH